MEHEYYNWTVNDLVEVTLESPDKFNLLSETLTRFGVQSVKDGMQVLNQTCHIIKGNNDKYYVVHFKELFALDGREHTITKSDIGRRNKIITLLERWNTLKIVDKEKVKYFNPNPMDNIHIVKRSDVDNWILQKKYEMPLKAEHLFNFLENTSET